MYWFDLPSVHAVSLWQPRIVSVTKPEGMSRCARTCLQVARGVSLATPTILFAVYEGMDSGDGGMLRSLRCSLYGE